MPLKVYCQCGECTEYTLNKPAFCAACGSKFGGSVSIARKNPQPQIAKELEIEDIEDEEIESQPTEKIHPLHGLKGKNRRGKLIREEDIDVEELNINSLQLDVPISAQKEKGIKFETVAFQRKTGLVRDKVKAVDKKKEFEKFLTEAASDRKGKEVNDPNPE